jgi:hypothetical protein
MSRRRCLFALVFSALLQAPAAWAQCVAFLVPPNTPIFRNEDSDALWSSRRKDYTLAYPTLRARWSPSGPLIRLDSSSQLPQRAACLPDDFKRSREGRLRVLIPGESDGSLSEVWVTDLKLAQIGNVDLKPTEIRK